MVPVGAIGPVFSVGIVMPATRCLRLIRDIATCIADPSHDAWGLYGLGLIVEVHASSRRSPPTGALSQPMLPTKPSPLLKPFAIDFWATWASDFIAITILFEMIG
jgi:hypothetical protein